ncbi:MAG: hypothetical protein GOMPHAMPRED_004954 [Gomphillus americanus]|uniref:Uncharacterized protein n=1 Tax=Gomphillus americanus TaxID=1940652 RepID=A0A8H3I4C4_9LECA|nr:MAG: hypothetical protein GOMPHAMPRED_004954 [Gomphillus americanus]
MWFASAAFATAQTALNPKLGEARTVAGERIAKIFYKVLTYQDTTQPNPPRELGETLDFTDFSEMADWMNDDFFSYDTSFL